MKSHLANVSFVVSVTIMILLVATAVTTTAAYSTTTAPPSAGTSSGIIQLSAQPVYQERQIGVSETAINQTHVELVNSGNGTLTLPNTTETISTTSTGSIIVSLDGNGAGKEVITTEDGSESVTATIYAIARFGMEGGRGITIALLDTNSTGRLAPLDGMILAGHIEFYPDGSAESTMWEWQSGVPLPTTAATTSTAGGPAPTNTTTTTAAGE